MSPITPIDNERIVDLIRTSDPRGEQLLYESYFKGLRYLALRYSHEFAEDCVQDTMMTAIQQIKAGQLEIPAALPGYLRTMVKRKAWDKNRKEERRTGDGETFEIAISSQADHRPNPEVALQEADKIRVMRECLELLKPNQREILIRFYLEGQSPDQICEAMGLRAKQYDLLKSRSKKLLEESVQKAMNRTPTLMSRLAAIPMPC